MTEPQVMGPEKLHVYGILSRRTWQSKIHGLEITKDRFTVLYAPQATQ